MSFVLMLGVGVFGGGLLMHHTAAGQQRKTEQDGDKPATSQSDPPKRDAGTVTEVKAKHGAAKTDLDRLQGVWSVVSMECGGKPSQVDKAVFMVDGKRACWQIKDSEIQGGLYLEPTSKPKTYDLAMSMRTIEGIYSLEGDTLRLCYDMGTDSKRPGSFITEKGSQQVLVVLKRTLGREVFPFLLPDGTRAFPTIIESAKTPPPPPRLITPQPKANKLNAFGAAEQLKDEQRNKTVTDMFTPEEVRPPKAADQREYVLMSRLMEAGAHQPKEVVVLPRVTVDDGQLGGMRIMDGMQKLPAKVRLDERFKIGTFFDAQVRHLDGNKFRLFVSFQKNEIEKLDDGEILVLGNNVQAIQDVELHKPVKVVLQKDARGLPQRWVEITVDDQIIPPPAESVPQYNGGNQ
jgi:uncharacterized protein (TIGR03067 family)